MKIKCSLLGHKWNGCVCLRCGKKRHDHHEWNGCVCKNCGEANPLATHEAHQWDGCRCKKCGAYAPQEYHDWDVCVCRRCGLQAPESGPHDWELVKCETSESESDEWYGGHFVTMTTVTEERTFRCRRCGCERQDISSWC